ncbi:MAG: ribonucleoside triphosphate reductase [Candidatus Brocadiia bacterium]
MPVLPKAIRKRDGSIVPWDESRIYNAILNAAKVTGEFDENAARMLTDRVVKVISLKFNPENEFPKIEQIQDIVEDMLIQADYISTARAYISYRQKRAELRKDRATLVEVEKTINEYLEASDWRVKANANQGYSLGGLILNISGKLVANYWLARVYPPEVENAHREGFLHVHDLDMYSGYCAGWSLRMLLEHGFNGIPNKVEAGPPRHLSSAVGQMVNFLGTLQNEWAGAQAFSSFDTYLAPFVKKDHLTYKEVKQNIQEFIYNLNVPSRWGTQTPFTNVTFDLVCPGDLRDEKPLMGGERMPFTYGECQKEMDLINKAYLEVMFSGDIHGRIFTFPIPTYNITADFPWDSPNADMLFALTAKYGTPYFQNFLNSDLDPHMVRSMCCRLRLDVRELLKRGNGLFGSAEQTGSLGVITINCARLGYVAKGDETKLLALLDEYVDVAKVSLEIKRKTIQGSIDKGLLPFTKRFLGTLHNHFSTIGINGVNEMIRNYTGGRENIATEWGQRFALRFMDHLRDKIVSIQEETGNLYNLEASPAESATHRFAREDQKRYPGILQAGTKEQPYYTNSTQLPVNYTDDPFMALQLQEELQSKYTGGTVFHVYVGESLDGAACKALVKRALERFRVPYITVTPTFSVCPEHGYLKGTHEKCPKCAPKEQPCEVWTRVMGYYRPVSQFNTGKLGEFGERKYFQVENPETVEAK